MRRMEGGAEEYYPLTSDRVSSNDDCLVHIVLCTDLSVSLGNVKSINKTASES